MAKEGDLSQNKYVRSLLAVALSVLCFSIVYLFLWGKLFPFSPVIIGFAKHELSHTVIYVQHGASFDAFDRIDACVEPVERFHELTFPRKPHIFVFRDRANYQRRSISKARFCAFYNGSLVIAPWALEEDRKGIIDLSIYVRHELSHDLLFMHKGILTAYRYPKWLLEGIAMYSAGQMGTLFYPDIMTTCRLIAEGSFMPPEYYHTKREESVRIDAEYQIAFIYSEFGCMVDYMVKSFGRKKFLAYMKTLLRDDNHDRVFSESFGIEFDQFLADFKTHARALAGLNDNQSAQ